jgi:hypothetical protein
MDDPTQEDPSSSIPKPDPMGKTGLADPCPVLFDP